MEVPKKFRLDLYLVHKGLAPSRSKAKELIEDSGVKIELNNETKIIQTPSYTLTKDPITDDFPKVTLLNQEVLKYVSRAALKLEGALEQARLDVLGWRVLDMGLSTGGFAHCLLQRKAELVVGVDVGSQQLSPLLRNHSALVSYENLNGRDLKKHSEFRQYLEKPFDLATVDVSFISLKLILPELIDFIKEKGYLLALVKPQFELGAKALSKKGVVKDPHLYEGLEEDMRSLCQRLQLEVLGYWASQKEGRQGNKEFFIFAQKMGSI